MIDPGHCPYRLVRSNRRTLSLSLDDGGVVTARAPRRMPIAEVERFIAQKAGWIQQKQAQALARRAAVNRYGIWDGGVLPYLGTELTVRLAEVSRPVREGDILYLPRRGDGRQHALRWLGEQALAVLPPRVEQWAAAMGVAPSSLRFGHARQRWGSMSGAGAMRLNIGLMHCAPALADYVIVHELAHRVHPDHSPAFHAYVAKVLPNAALLRGQMKEAAPLLRLLQPDHKEEAR